MNTLQFQGRELFWQISPCSWMYRGYGLQISLSLIAKGCNAECEFILDKSIPADTMKAEAMDEAGEALALRWLNQHGLAPLQAKLDAWAKIAAEFAVESAKEREKEEKRQAKQDAKMKAQGYTHRVDGWIHPKAGGDDRMFQGYVKGKPTDAEIQTHFLSRSAVKNDYRVIAL